MEDLLKKLQNVTLLYVEDDLDILATEQKNFEFFFKKVFIASDGEEALQIYKEEKVDLIILDIQMPKINGIDVAKKIRSSDLNTPIIMLTAHSDEKYLFEAVKLKLEEYLVKPVDLKILLTLLEKIFIKNQNFKQESILANKTVYDSVAKTVTNQEKLVKLGEKETLLLELLLQNPTKTFSKHEIKEAIWQDNGSDASYRNLIRNLRNKIGKEALVTLPGIGLKLADTN